MGKKIKNKLTVFLIKDSYENHIDILTEEILESDRLNKYIIDDISIAYFTDSITSPPKWVDEFFESPEDLSNVNSASSRLVLISKVLIGEEYRFFAITMGYGRSLIKGEAVEEYFGLKTVLNTINFDSIRRISKSNVGGNQKSSSEQMPTIADISEFGLDVHRDILKNISAKSDVAPYFKGVITGGEQLSATVPANIKNIDKYLIFLYENYKKLDYKENFSWIDNIQMVKNETIINELNILLIDDIKGQGHKFYMAVPEVIDWSGIQGFKYNGTTIFDDIDTNTVLSSARVEISIDWLSSKKIDVIDSSNEQVILSWTAYKCFFGEVDFEDDTYCINNGKWYKINSNYVSVVNDFYNNIPLSSINFNDYNNDNEESYTKELAKDSDYIFVDKSLIMHGGGRSRIEVADLISRSNEFIHIKHYAGSAPMSHLFNQGLVSFDLTKFDSAFLEKTNDMLKRTTGANGYLINKKNTEKMKVVYAIISKNSGKRPSLPFFAKVALKYVVTTIIKQGGTVEISNIVDIKNKIKKSPK